MKVIRQLYSSGTIRRKPPLNLKKGDEVYFGGASFEYTLPESSFVYIGKATVTSQGIIMKHFLPLRRFIVCYAIDFKQYYFRYIGHVLWHYKKQRLKDDKKYVIIFDNYSGPKGFYHWICDGLTRLAEIRDELKDYTVLLPAYFKQERLYSDTLKLFDIAHEYVITEKTCVTVDHLYAVDFIAPTGNFNQQNFHKLQRLVWDTYKLPDGEAYDKIYISRGKASRRFVINEREVGDLLQQYGFRIVHLEDHPFEEQVRLVTQARYLVSIHGAALTHVFFMQPGSHVLEFKRMNDASNYVYFSLADVAGVNYYYQFCEVTEKSKHANNFDLAVDISDLQTNIEWMLSKNE